MMNMSKKEMPKTYDPHATEQRLYNWWEAQGYFKPETQSEKGLADHAQKPFVISMPPPNVTGGLHLGHAITASVEDLMIRYHRMRGDPTLWVPGSDHAGIATQNVVERELAKEGLTRHDLGREKFVERAWQWKEKYGNIIAEQHRRLGVSCDWDRERFTLDEGLYRAVRVAFVQLYEKGLIYRGTYLINWCPRCETAISDLEVIHQEEATKLWYVRYPLVDGQWPTADGEWGGGQWAEGATEYIEVATTRPETILGDTAVAVNPDDPHYKPLVGREAILPALGRRIPIITDPSVDPEFGTGAVKVTPAHDPTDYEIGQRHSLAAIDVLTDDGNMNEEAGPYAGQDRYECRRNLVADLEKEGLLVKIEDYSHSLGHCQRCDTVIEPRISTQWFVKIKPLAERAIEAVRDGRIRIVPERFTQVYYNWMENIRDWCISRQLWWGHRIPVWYCDDCDQEMAAVADPTECKHCGSTAIHQDEDVLDTWFSSGLWPFSTLGWPDDTEDLRYFYPTTVMETGYDILFFWVARMIMLGLECTGDIPFDTIYLHGLIRDEHGQKMSKSRGNAIDPLEVMNQYGTDALRFTLLTGSTPGNDMSLALSRVEANRNFANKIWNATRFVVNTLGYGFTVGWGTWDMGALTLADHWILSRHNRLIGNVTRLIDAYQFGEAGRQIYDFLWGEFCDWYIEISKIRLYGRDARRRLMVQRVLVYVLERALRLLHPFMPLVTEALWQELPHEGESLMIAPWPEPRETNDEAEEEMDLVMGAIRAIRNARAEYEVEPGQRIEAIISAGERYTLLKSQKEMLVSLARLDDEKLRLAHTLVKKPAKALTLVIGGLEIYLPLEGMVDLAAERERLNKEVEALSAAIARSEGLLTNKDFTRKAPVHVVDREREKLATSRERKAKLEEHLKSLEA
jgi:valyl-tRNA synthetase